MRRARSRSSWRRPASSRRTAHALRQFAGSGGRLAQSRVAIQQAGVFAFV